jgi:hypothetical protein
MGTWSITPTPHPLISISTSGEVTVQRHDSTTTYTINYTPDADECSGTVITKTLTVYACEDSCTCETVGGLSVGADTSTTEVQVGTYTSSTSCPSATWQVTGVKSGTNFLTGFRFSGGKIYAKVNVANPNASTRTTQYNVSYGSCTDYFSVVQQGKSIPSTYSYTLKSNITGATVSFRIGSSTLTDTTDSFGNATVTSTTNANATATITKSGSPNEKYFFQYSGSCTIPANGSKRLDGALMHVDQTASAQIYFNEDGFIANNTNLILQPTNVTFGVNNKPSWVRSISFSVTTSGTVNVSTSSLADNLPSGITERGGTATLTINGVPTNQSVSVAQGDF